MSDASEIPCEPSGPLLDHPSDLGVGSKPAPGDLVYVQGFVNTVDLESGRDALGTGAGAARWFVHHGLAAPGLAVDDAAHERVVALREALRAMLFSNHGDPVEPAAVRTLNEIASSAPLRVAFAATGEARLAPDAAAVDGALAQIVALVYDAMREGVWGRLKACRSDACRWAFYDASRNRSGSWCTMAVCGNRKKVEEFRKRAGEG